MMVYSVVTNFMFCSASQFLVFIGAEARSAKGSARTTETLGMFA